MAAFLGMRGNGDWVANQQPENWRQAILYLYPNGSAPLTAMLSMLGSESTDDPTFHWWTKSLPDQSGSVTAVFNDTALTSSATGAKAAGVTLYFQVAEATADEFRPGHQAMAQKGSDFNYAYIGKVVDVVKNGASSYIAVRLLEAASSTFAIVSSDTIEVSGNMNPEGGTRPASIAYDPTEYFNRTQIFRNSLDITDTARQTHLRTGDGYAEAKREALELHAIEMEKAFTYGAISNGTGANGKPERSTQGLRNFIIANSAANVDTYGTLDDATYRTVAWTAAAGGFQWFMEKLELIYRFGQPEKFGLIGNLGLLGLNRLAVTNSDVNITPMTVSYGFRVLEWFHPFGTLFLKTAPLMSRTAALRRDVMVFEPEKVKYRYVRNRDTRFISDPRDSRNRNNSVDGTEEEYITEAGLEIHHPSTMGYLAGLGIDGACV